MNGADMYRMVSAGASGVQLGTAFLPCIESTASAAHKRYLLTEAHRGCAYTTTFSGRPAQGIRNAFMDAMAGAPVLDFPLQNTLTSVLRSQAVRADDGEMQSLWAGTAYHKARERLLKSNGSVNSVADDYISAGELVQRLQYEYLSEL